MKKLFTGFLIGVCGSFCAIGDVEADLIADGVGVTILQNVPAAPWINPPLEKSFPKDVKADPFPAGSETILIEEPETILFTEPPESVPADWSEVPFEMFPESADVILYPDAPSEIPVPTPEEMAGAVALYGDLKRFFLDHDNLTWHKRTDEFQRNLQSWLTLYKQFAQTSPEPVAFAALPPGSRIVSYVKLPQNDNEHAILAVNLAFYKNQGYNGILFLFDDLDHTPESLELIRTIRSVYGFRVWGAYAPDDSYWDGKTVTLPDPVRYSAFLREIAPELDAYVLAYLRMSCHYFLQDPAYIHFVTSALRSAKANLPILGEAYYGYTVRFRNDRSNYWSFNSFCNASADLIQNRGHASVDQATAVKATPRPRVGVVIGRRAEWLTKTSDTWESALKSKQRIEQSFLAAGCVGTVTEHGDGNCQIRTHNGKTLTNNLSKTVYTDCNAIKK